MKVAIVLLSIFGAVCCIRRDVSSFVRLGQDINDGRYVHDNSGQYHGDDGRYHPDNSGQYTHDYKQDKDVFGPDGGNGGRYVHTGDKFGTNGGVRGNLGAVVTVSGAGGAVESDRFVKYTTSGQLGLEQASVVPVQNKFQYKSQDSVAVTAGNVAGNAYEVRPTYGASASSRHDYNYGIIRQEGHNEEDGYHYLYETENSITGEEQGKLAHVGTENEAMQARGSYSYTGPDNVVYTVQYTADENGFVPSGAHIPTPPPIPEAIVRSLEYQKSLGVL